MECDLGIISDPDCPVDGSWTTWSAWSPCKGSCDNIGHRIRTRECNNPAPSKDGVPCSGPDEDTTPCHLTNCTVKDFKKLAMGDSGRTEALNQLTAAPALMARCLQTECPFESIEAALAYDNTWQLSSEAIWNSLQCVKHNMGCPVIGEWGAWGEWSACGAQCGQGVRWRLRRCDTPPPSDASRICTGNPLEAEDCEGDQCAIEDQVDYGGGGTWSEWQQWSECLETCGPGARRRRRVCNEKKTQQLGGTWGTHCQGQHDELEVCENKVCVLDGAWSGWSVWGPCSQSCGAGTRSRSRSCTRPIPAGGGSDCVGHKYEVGSCHLAPCEVFTHTVAILNGESFFHYDFEHKRSTLFHFYIRFMPLSPHGTLVRRGNMRNPNVRLSLQKWHVCLDAEGTSKSCSLPRVCSPSVIESGAWHTALVTVSSDSASLRLDDARTPIRSTFPCEPELEDEKMDIIIGEKFHGELQEAAVNFIPLVLTMDENTRYRRSNFVPTSTTNIAYEKAGIEEAFLNLAADQYLRLPCFDDQNEWRLELTLKSKRDSGTILFLRDDSSDSWLHLSLQNMRMNLRLGSRDFRSESSGSTEYLPDQWLDVVMLKKTEANSVETSINAGERIHAVIEEANSRHRRYTYKIFNPLKKLRRSRKDEKFDDINNKTHTNETNKVVPFLICSDEFYVGGVPQEFKSNSEDFVAFAGIIALININGELQDLHKFDVERSKGDQVQLSSRTASISGSYHESSWGSSNSLNLTCLHARTARSPRTARWIFLDTGIDSVISTKKARSIDDGRVLRLVATATNDLRGFYTCRSHAKKITRNIVTYGVIGKMRQRLTSPDTTTAIALVTTLILIVGTLTWIVSEGINDLRNGYGFFRDRHLTPQQEAEAVCNYIDANIELIGSKSLAKLAKARARRKGQRLASKINFAAQEPQGMMAGQADSDSTLTETEALPDLPAIKSSSMDKTQDIFRCEPCYVSSPRHGSNITSPRPKLTSSSSPDTSPRILCSRLLITRGYQARERRKKGSSASKKQIASLLTIKSSAFVNQSPAQKILQRFRELKSEDS